MKHRGQLDRRVEEATAEQAGRRRNRQRQIVGTGIRDGDDTIGVDDHVFHEVARQVAAAKGDPGGAGDGQAVRLRRRDVGGAL